MSRSQQRMAALRFLAAVLLWIGCVFGWLAVLSFDAADWPSTTVWPINSPPANWCGDAGAWAAHLLFYYFGAGTYALILLATGAIAAYSHGVRMTDLPLRFIGTALVVGVIGTLAAMYLPLTDRWLISGPGGVLGTVLHHTLMTRLQTGGTLITLAAALIVGLILAADQAMLALLRWLGVLSQKAAPVIIRTGGQALASAGAAVAAGVAGVANRLSSSGEGEAQPATVPAGRGGRLAMRGGTLFERGAKAVSGDYAGPVDRASAAKPSATPPPRNATAAATVRPVSFDDDDFADAVQTDALGDDAAVDSDLESVEPESNESSGEISIADDSAEAPVAAPPKVTALGGPPKPAKPMALEFPLRVGNFELPPLTLLEDADPIDKEAIESLCREKAYVLEQTLNEFRHEVQVVAIETGPVITVFELRLSPGIKVSQIASLTNDMARALKAPAVRVVAPLPGKNTIGIEVPNLDKEKVRIKDLIRSTGTRGDAYMVPLYLGKDASGAALVADITKMPHLLIAGTTGSGKSVCISSIIMSILMTRTPEEVQLLLIDPKVVELAMYRDIPHLMCPIVTDATKADKFLEWAATAMDERYALLAEAGVKDIRSYNRLGREALRERLQIETDEEMDKIPVKLPYLIIIVDELADLMMTSAKEVEFYLCRIAQKSRAVGIHLIVSTQRPQANVVTGLIKSNLPCRIAFRVSSRLDSRIVLDQNGGEVLMGQGDMLFLPPGSSKLMRAQGTFIADDELRAVVKHARTQGQPQYHPELVRLPKSVDELGERDELFDQSVDIIIESQRGSVSLLQRKLGIGYSRASRLIEQMFAAGIVGDFKNAQAREVVLTKEEWQAIKQQRDSEEAAESAESA